MAAGAYKGLTIRIGADTTKLSSALRGANSVIYKTQSELRKLAKAAKIDPGNNKVYSMQMGAVANEAMAAAKKVDLLNKSMKEMRGTQATGESATIGMIADDTENAALAAENAKERYSSLSAEIERVSDTIETLNGTDLSAAVRESSEAYEEAKQKLLEWANEVENQDAVAAWEEKNGIALESAINDIEHLRDTWQEASAQYDDAKLVEALHNAEVEAAATEVQIKALGQEMANLKTSSDFGRSFSELDSRIQLTTAAVDAATDRFTRLDRAAKLNPANLNLAVERTKAMADATEAAQVKAGLLKEKIQAYKDSGIEKIAKSMGNVSLEIERTKKAYADSESEVARLKGELDNAQSAYQRLIEVGHSDNMAQDINKASDEVDRLEKELREAESARDKALSKYDTAQQCGELQELKTQARETKAELQELTKFDFSKLGNIGSAAVMASQQVGQLAMDVGRKVVDSSNDIDKSYRNLRKTFNSSEADYQMLYDAAMKYSQSNVTSADTMLEMESIAAQLGVGLAKTADGSKAGAEGIRKFAEAAANLDVATDIDADTIALQMGQIMNVMDDLNVDNVDKFGDALVRLGNNMPTQESNIMQITQRLSSIGDVAHFSTPQLLGWAAAIASTGQKSEAAATGIATTITKIGTAVSTGGDDLKKFAKVAGMSAKDFAKAWRSDPSDTLRKVVKGLKDSGDDLFATLVGMDVNGVRQTQTLASLAQTIDNLDNAVGMADSAFNGLDDDFGQAGDAANEAGKKAEGFSGTLAKLQNSGQVLAATFGESMVEPMEWLAGKLNWLTGVIDSWSSDTKEKVVLAAGGFAAFTTAWPVLSALGSSLAQFASGSLSLVVDALSRVIVYGKSLASIIGSWVKAPVEVAGALSKMSGAAGALGTVLGFLATPLGVVVGAVALLAAALGGEYLIKTYKAKKSAEEFQGALNGIKDVTEDLGQSLYLGSDAIDKYAEKWSAARVNMEDYHKQLKEHTDKQMEAREAMEQTVGSLDKYQSIISNAIGKGDRFAGNLGELQYAIDKLNELTGSSWTLQDILTGKYKDEEGAIRDTKAALDELIQSKKLEAQISGIESALSENEAAKALNKRERDVAAKNYQNAIDLKLKYKDSQPQFIKDMTNSEYIAYLQATDDHIQGLMLDSMKLREENRALDEQYIELTNTLGGLIDQQSYKTSSNYGERESIMRLGSGVDDLMKSYLGFTDDTIEAGVKGIAQGMQDLKVGTTEFAEMAPDVFENLLQQADGSSDKFVELVDKWNHAHLDEKYGIIEWGDGGQWFIDAEHVRHDWNGNEWVVHTAEVQTEDSALDETEAKEDEIKAKAEEGATMKVGSEDHEVDSTKEKVESITDEEKTVTYKANEDGSLSDVQSKVQGLEDKDVNITFKVDDGGISEAKSALDSLKKKDVKVSIKADTSGASAITEALSGLSGKPIDVKINADTSGATEITNALAGLSGKPIDVKINADTSGAQLVAGAINSIPDQKNVSVSITADTSAAMVVSGVLNSIPPVTTATITAVTNNVAAATTRITKLNEASGAMKSEKKTYEAKGNAANSSSPASNIKSLNNAAGNMSSKSATYTAYGNAANGSAASHVWDLVRAINNLSSKSVTVTTNYVNNGKPGGSATGAYIPYNKMPRHAAGIFTKPTLTNIGWVGESGAELYSGNSLVPLTNRKYSMPYIDDISDAVAKKLGGAGTTYNLSIDGAKVNDDPAIQAAILNLFDVLMRKGAMNRG